MRSQGTVERTIIKKWTAVAGTGAKMAGDRKIRRRKTVLRTKAGMDGWHGRHLRVVGEICGQGAAGRTQAGIYREYRK